VEAEDTLREAISAQAHARVAGDIATFASFMTPQALLRLHRQGEPLRAGHGVKRYNILDITERGDAAMSDVRYEGAGSYVLRTRWERPDGLWKAVMVEMPADLRRAPWWRRLLGLGRAGADPAPTERRDLR
jgi:hypothetical protein